MREFIWIEGWYCIWYGQIHIIFYWSILKHFTVITQCKLFRMCCWFLFRLLWMPDISSVLHMQKINFLLDIHIWLSVSVHGALVAKFLLLYRWCYHGFVLDFETPKKQVINGFILKTPKSAMNDTGKIKKTKKRVAPSPQPHNTTSSMNLTDLRKVYN